MLHRFVQVALVVILAMLVFNSAPYASAIAKEKCVTVGEKKVCFEDGKNKKEDDDDDDDDDDEKKPKKKKKKGAESGLTECTIEAEGGGGGCKKGFKRVCEKMKSGKKCCGCVTDPSLICKSFPGGTTLSDFKATPGCDPTGTFECRRVDNVDHCCCDTGR
jgi:hypothetical protein